MAASAYLEWASTGLALCAHTAETAAPAAPRHREGPHDQAVIGYAVGYDIAEIAPFVRSLRAVFSGRVILVVDRRPTLLSWLATHAIETVIACDRLLHWKPHPVVERFAVYAQILQERPNIQRVIATDVRDVVFQGDPFGEPEGRLQFFVEAEGRTLAEHPFNLKHLKALVGERLAEDLGGRPCVCVGVVAGPASAMLRFCRAVLLLCAIPRSQVGGAFGADQAACNVIAHLDLAEGEIHPNFGRVATIGLTAPDQLNLVDGKIVNPDGAVSPIVHQYDRIPLLARHVEARWGLPSLGGSRPFNRIRKRLKTLRASVLRRLPELR